MRLACLLIFSLTILMASGCQQNNNDNQLRDIQKQLATLQNQVADLSSSSSKQTQVNQAFYQALTEDNAAIFTPSSQGYTTVKTNVGYFVVALTKISKYANGYQLNFNIGNPSAMTFSGAKVMMRWGKSFSPTSNFTDWYNSLKYEEVEITKPLLPGVWNKVSVVISPATDEETGYINLSLGVNKVYLYSDLRK